MNRSFCPILAVFESGQSRQILGALGRTFILKDFFRALGFVNWTQDVSFRSVLKQYI